MKPSAKVICDSITKDGHRLVTMEVVMHRFILAEMNTHRAFSRNSASSRAIPYNKIRERVTTDPAYPVHWGSEIKGMQSGQALSDEDASKCLRVWDTAMIDAVKLADVVKAYGLHKSLINRLLEPFMWHTAIISATEWDNFFWQRCDPAAQPEMKAVADEMQRAYYRSTPRVRYEGEWHLPYIQEQDWEDAGTLFDEKQDWEDAQEQDWEDAGTMFKNRNDNAVTRYMKMVSTARCARVSYLTHDGQRNIEKDAELFEKLLESGHWSPFEHVATPSSMTRTKIDGHMMDVYETMSNFRGWTQFRKEFTEENRRDFVPNLPDLQDVVMEMDRAKGDKRAVGKYGTKGE